MCDSSEEQQFLELNNFLESDETKMSKQIPLEPPQSLVDTRIDKHEEEPKKEKRINEIKEEEKKEEGILKEKNVNEKAEIFNQPCQQPCQQPLINPLLHNPLIKQEISEHTDEFTEHEEPQIGLIIYVANLHFDITEELIHKYFDPFGPIIGVDIVYKPQTNECRGFAFIKYQKTEDGNKAIEALNDKEVQELTKTKLTVKVATNQQTHKKKELRKTVEPTTTLPKYSPSQMFNDPMMMYQQFFLQPMAGAQQPNQSANTQKPMYNPGIQMPQYQQGYIGPMGYWPDAVCRPQEKQKATLYIAHLPQNTNELFLYKNFAKFGAIEQCNCLYEPTTKLCKGVGFVTYMDSSDAYKAMQAMNNKVFDGQPIKVKFKNQK
ncbi:RNA recognition domain containing protein [Entamoeba histolytica KU27]|uniref:RNA recognition domain containing protein n=2 Tax=Entamoeba histolytica TaxID=5759 RepID=M2RM48_ENTHI|nr:RNA recognition domain containing protein [Entamoeba histolytica KU27]